MDVLLIVVVVVAGTFVVRYVYKLNRDERNKIKESRNSLASLVDFKPTRKIADDAGHLFALDMNSKKFLLDRSGKLEVHDFKEIIGFDISEQSEDISGQSSTNIICKANTKEIDEERIDSIDVISSANFILNKKIKGIELKIIFRAKKTVKYCVKLLDANQITKNKYDYISINNSTHGEMYKSALEISENWSENLTQIINENNYHQAISSVTKN